MNNVPELFPRQSDSHENLFENLHQASAAMIRDTASRDDPLIEIQQNRTKNNNNNLIHDA